MARSVAHAPEGLKLGEDFPFICEVCLGPNPYLRMIKMPNSRECKISGRPYTAFRWQPGSEARYKETIIAPEVAIAKNVCQTCNRCVNSACPYRPCNGTFRFPELASGHQEHLSTLVRKLHADGAVSVMNDTSPEMEEIRELLRDSQRGSRDNAIRARYHGTADDKLAQKYLDKASSMKELTPPEDEGITSLWVGGLPPDAPGMAQISKQDLQDAFYAHGEVSEIKMMTERRCAIVTYVLRKSAEEAAAALHKKLYVKNVSLKLWWAKAPSEERTRGGGASGAFAPPPPGSAPLPGQEGAPQMRYPSMNPSAMGARPDRG